LRFVATEIEAVAIFHLIFLGSRGNCFPNEVHPLGDERAS